MPSFTTRLADGWERALEHLPLAVVPLITTLLNTEKVGAVLTGDGFHLGLKLGTPISVVDLWTFVDPPSQGVAVDPGVPLVGLPLALVVVPFAIVVQAGLAAGYFGSIDEAMATGSYNFADSVAKYFMPFLLLTILPLVLFIPLAVLGVGGGLGILLPVVVLLIPLILVLTYLFYATPYLIVLRETDLLTAAKTSYELAIEGGPYVSYLVGFALFVLVVSPFASLLVVNVPVFGLVIGLVGGTVLGLAGNFATMRFVADIDPESSPYGSWDGGPEADDGTSPDTSTTPPRE